MWTLSQTKINEMQIFWNEFLKIVLKALRTMCNKLLQYDNVVVFHAFNRPDENSIIQEIS